MNVMEHYENMNYCPNCKKSKALEIIKNKRVNVEFIKCCYTYIQYKTICSYWSEITQDEFDIIKEVL